ncbi:MAG: VOC family protein [Xanthobacteraceae bacterium]|nr:VOC family protein [Xanthobacteraceae bacterium]
MAKLRHVAIAVKNPEKSAQFFEQAFGMTRVGNAMRGVYLSDGVINVALLNFGDEPVPGFETQKGYEGIIHFGMWVDDVDETDRRIKNAGGSYMTGRFEKDPNVFYEVKYKTPEGIVFDVTANGWKGAVKDVEPANREKVA